MPGVVYRGSKDPLERVYYVRDPETDEDVRFDKDSKVPVDVSDALFEELQEDERHGDHTFEDDAADPAELTVPQLRERLREAGEPTGGAKAELQERLRQVDSVETGDDE